MASLHPAVIFDRISHSYGPVRALHSLSLEIPQGEIWALVGENGAGKSTALRIIAGITEPVQGEVRVLGAQPDARNPAVAWLAQGASFSRSLRVADVVKFAACRRGLQIASVEDVLSGVGIGGAADWRVGLLPPHVVRRLGLAIAWLGDPAVLLLDEPTDGLDPEGRLMLIHLLERARGRTTVVLALRDLGPFERVVDHVVELAGGEVVRSEAVHVERIAPFSCAVSGVEEESLRAG